MALTVPKAGIIAGRSASVTVPVSETGGAVAQFGKAAMEIGTGMERDRLDRQAQRLQLDVTRDLGQMRQEFEQMGDPDAIDTLWPQRVAELKQKYLKGADAQGLPRVDPRIADRFDIAVTGLADSHANALGYKAIGLRQAQREATYIEQRQEITTQAATTDPGTLEVLIAQGEASIDAQVAAGIHDAAWGAAQKQQLRGEIYNSRAITMIEADPQGFLDAAEKGEFDALPAEALAQKKAQATNAVQQAEARAVTAAEVEANKRTAAIGKTLDDYIGIYDQGLAVRDESWLTDPEFQQHPKYGEAVAARELREEKPGIQQLSVDQLDALIASEEATPKDHKYQAERIKVLRSWRDTAAAGWGTDAIDTAQKAKMPVPPLAAFNPQDPTQFTNDLGARVSFDAYLQDKKLSAGQGIFSKADLAQLAPILKPEADIAPKLALAKSILGASGGKSDRILTALQAEPEFRRALTLMATTGDEGLATEILRGQQRKALGTVNLPSAANQRSILSEVTGGAFDGNPTLQAEILASATALYADGAGAAKTDVGGATPAFMDDPAAVDLFTASIQRVTGAQPDANGQLTIGGVQPIREAYVSLPVGTRAADVETGLENLQRHLDGQRWDPAIGGWDSSAMETPPDPLRAFAKAGLDGAKPDFGSSPRDLFPSLTLHRVSEKSDVYEFRYTVQGRTYTVRRAGDDKGRAYRFKLPDLIREAGK